MIIQKQDRQFQSICLVPKLRNKLKEILNMNNTNHMKLIKVCDIELNSKDASIVWYLQRTKKKKKR
jgi:hypothetical protein